MYTGIIEEPPAEIPSEVLVYDSDNGWFRLGHDIIDFGASNQEINDDFYAWFIANAKEQTYISGCFLLNSFNGTLLEQNEISSRANFRAGVANGKKCKSLLFNSSGFVCTETFLNIPYAVTSDTEIIENRIFDFGQKQVIETSVYNFLIDNSIKTEWKNHFVQVNNTWKYYDNINSLFNYFTPSQVAGATLLQEESLAYLLSYPSLYIKNKENDLVALRFIKLKGFGKSVIAFLASNEKAIVLYTEMYGWLDGSLLINMDSIKAESLDENNQIIFSVDVQGKIETSTKYQYITFFDDCYLTQEQYKQFIQNATKITTTGAIIECNNKIVTQLKENEEATLMCENKKIPTNIRVSTFQKPKQQLTIIEGETVNEGYEWDFQNFWLHDIEWDFSVSFAMYPVGIKKLSNIYFPNRLASLISETTLINAYGIGKNNNMGESAIQGTYFTNMLKFLTDSGYMTSMVQLNSFILTPLLLYVENADVINRLLGNHFEDKTVYLHNYMLIDTFGGRNGKII